MNMRILLIFIAIVTQFHASVIPAIAHQRNYQDEFLHLKGQFRSFDPTRRTLEITCAGLLLGADGNDLYLGATLEARRNITIYTDVQTEIDTSIQQGEKLPYTPTSVIPPIPTPAGLIGNQQFSTFTVDVTMVPRRSVEFLTAEFRYPWDEWVGRKVFVAANDSGSGVVPLYDFRTDDTFMNYLIATHSHSSCFDPIVERCELSVTFVMSRHYFVVACAVAVVVFNWIMAATIFVFTFKNSNEQLRVVGVTVGIANVYAMPGLKNWLGDAPSFSLIDLIGILPTVIATCLCVAWNVLFLVREQHAQRQSPTR